MTKSTAKQPAEDSATFPNPVVTCVEVRLGKNEPPPVTVFVEFVVLGEPTKARMFVVEQTQSHTSQVGGIPEKG